MSAATIAALVAASSPAERLAQLQQLRQVRVLHILGALSMHCAFINFLQNKWTIGKRVGGEVDVKSLQL